MIETWRDALYPIGYIAGIFFGLRFFLQWIQSERKKKSVVPLAFWKISVGGNFLNMLHSFIQIQFHACLIQGCMGVLAWRHLNLLEEDEKRVSKSTVHFYLGITIFAITLFFFMQSLFTQDFNWFHSPTSKWSFLKQSSAGIGWHILGTLGLVLFSGRFWIQWWYNEKHQICELGPMFWWLSLVGNSLSLIYFVKIGDLVHVLGPTFGFIPYIRNLILIQRAKKVTTT